MLRVEQRKLFYITFFTYFLRNRRDAFVMRLNRFLIFIFLCLCNQYHNVSPFISIEHILKSIGCRLWNGDERSQSLCHVHYIRIYQDLIIKSFLLTLSGIRNEAHVVRQIRFRIKVAGSLSYRLPSVPFLTKRP